MATPLRSASPPSLKRPSSASVTQGTPSKKQKRRYHHRHGLERPLNLQVPGSTIGDEPSVDQLFTSSIGRVLNETGFEQAEPVALDALRGRAEEHLLHLLSCIRQSMYICRRTQPIPYDFEYALRNHSIAIDSLYPLLNGHPSSPKPPPLLPTPPPEEPKPRTSFPFLGGELCGTTDRRERIHIPQHFPVFPSKHTYQQTDVFTKRDIERRKVREQATEEGRQGEEALRKLARAAKDSQALSRQHAEKKLWGRSYESMETMFDKTLKAMSADSASDLRVDGNAGGEEEMSSFPGLPPPPSPDATQQTPLRSNPKLKGVFEMAPIVNCDRNNWRKSSPTDFRKAKRQSQSSDPSTPS